MLDLLNAQASARPEAVRSQLPFGFNVIGYASANLGQGVALRNTVGLLVHAGIPFCVVDVDAGGGRSGHDGSLRGRFHELGSPLPYGINLFQMNPPEIKLLRTGAGRALGMEERMNVCVPFWELPKLPPSWIPELSDMDLLLAPSRFIHGVLDAQVGSVPLRYYPQWLAESPRSAPDRARWNLPASRTVFLCSFDAASDFFRKNAGGAVLAFAQAFEGRDDRAMLVIKINNVRMNLETARRTETFATEALRLRGVRLITEAMAYLDVQSLYASVDVYISLHRGEGLGLGMMECMALGKPVIATDWSGNMDFMDDSSACLVGHRKIEVTPESSYHAASEGIPQVWAQPNLDEAATWMRRLADDADFRHDIGQRASEAIRRFLDISGRADAFEGLRTYFGSTWKSRSRWTPVDSTPPAVLIQNRDDMDLLPGGDTILARSIRDALTSIGTRSAISSDYGHELRDADLVQLINISRTSDTLLQLRNARKRGRPTVLIPLYEDMDRYLVKATGVHLTYQYLLQKKQVLPPDQLIALATQVPLPSHPLDNDTCRRFGIGDATSQREILAGCDHVVTSGRAETGLLRRRFGFTAPASEIHYGIDPVFSQADGALFRARYGMNEFALCVGRIETRKNTWTLIEVFRGMPDKQLVLIGQFEDPALESLVRAYAPKNVVFLKNLPRDELVSSYAAARLHVLPSWYELPGLVSLEAAAAGCRVVTTSWGTAYDHFGDRVHYCEPDAPATIRKAVLEAWDSAADPTLREYAMETFDWRRTARELARIYAEVLSSRASSLP